MQLLVVENQAVDLQVIERALVSEFTITNVCSIAEALELLRQQLFDLVLFCPPSDRPEEICLDEMAPLLAVAPVIVLGRSDDAAAAKFVASGAQDYLRKSELSDYPLGRSLHHAVSRHRAAEARNLNNQQQIEDDLRRKSERLRETEQIARWTVDSLSAHIAILNQDGTIVAVNRAWEAFAAANGLHRDECGVGANYIDVCESTDQLQNPDDTANAQAAARGIREILNGQQEECYLEYPCHAPTEERWFAMRVTRFGGEGSLRAVVSHENITARKVAEQLERERSGLKDAVASMEKVLGVVGHELRTPLAAVRAISEFLITDGARETEQWSRFLNDMSQEVDRMADTVNNILEAARLNSGRARWNWGDIDLADTCEQAFETIRPLIDTQRVTLNLEIEPPAFAVRGDGDGIRRLIVNLLSNARKFTTEGQINLRASTFTDTRGNWVNLMISDTGEGIAPEILDKLGEAFSLNAGVVGASHVGGTGLGFAICKGIVLAHGGEMHVFSEKGFGTTVMITFRADLEAAATGDTHYHPQDDLLLAVTL